MADAELRLRDAASKKILLEVALLKAIEARNAMPLDAVLKQLNQLRGGQRAGVRPQPATSPSTAAAPANRPCRKTLRPPIRQHRRASRDGAKRLPVSADLAELWTQLMEAVGRVSPFTRSYLVDANPVSFEKNILVIGFDPEFEDHLGLVDNARNHTLLQTKLAELGHPNCQIKFIKAEAPVGRVAKPSRQPPAASNPPRRIAAKRPRRRQPPPKRNPRRSPFNKDDFKNDPLIQKALEIFKGQIVEVRA